MIASYLVLPISRSSFWSCYINYLKARSKTVNSNTRTLYLGIHQHALITLQLIQSHTWDTTTSLQQLRLSLGCALCICLCTTAQVQVRGGGVGGGRGCFEMIPHPRPRADGPASVADVVNWGLWASCNTQAQQPGARSSVGPVWCSPDNHPSPLLQLQWQQWRWAGPEALPLCLPWVPLSGDEPGVCHQCSLQARAPLWSALHLKTLLFYNLLGNTGTTSPPNNIEYFLLIWIQRLDVKHDHMSSCPD